MGSAAADGEKPSGHLAQPLLGQPQTQHPQPYYAYPAAAYGYAPGPPPPPPTLVFLPPSQIFVRLRRLRPRRIPCIRRFSTRTLPLLLALALLAGLAFLLYPSAPAARVADIRLDRPGQQPTTGAATSTGSTPTSGGAGGDGAIRPVAGVLPVGVGPHLALPRGLRRHRRPRHQAHRRVHQGLQVRPGAQPLTPLTSAQYLSLISFGFLEVVDQSWLRGGGGGTSVVRSGILHTIFFHQTLTLVRLKDVDCDLFEITYVQCGLAELEKVVDENIN